MRRTLASSLAVLCLAALVALGLVGCSRQPRPVEWTASVRVQGNTAVVTVDLPRDLFGKGYHPHLSLDGGPEVMLYTPSYTLTKLAPGTHQVRIVVHDANHRPIPGMEKTLTFEVK